MFLQVCRDFVLCLQSKEAARSIEEDGEPKKKKKKREEEALHFWAFVLVLKL